MVGTDIVLISRIEEAAGYKNFFKRTLTANEQEYLNKKSKDKGTHKYSPYFMSLAGFFAVKESVLKAAGVGVTNGFGFLDVEIDHAKGGAPVVKLSPRLQKYVEKLGAKKVDVSLSHDGEYATAVAMIL